LPLVRFRGKLGKNQKPFSFGNDQTKLTHSNRPKNWLHQPIEKQDYTESTIKAINEAHYLYQWAQTSEEKNILKRLKLRL